MWKFTKEICNYFNIFFSLLLIYFSHKSISKRMKSRLIFNEYIKWQKNNIYTFLFIKKIIYYLTIFIFNDYSSENLRLENKLPVLAQVFKQTRWKPTIEVELSYQKFYVNYSFSLFLIVYSPCIRICRRMHGCVSIESINFAWEQW